MKNLFKVAFCFTIKDDVSIVKEEYIIPVSNEL